MNEFLFGTQLSDQDCLDLGISQEYIEIGIQSQIDFIISFHQSIDPDTIEYLMGKTLKNLPEIILCKFRGEIRSVIICWHD